MNLVVFSSGSSFSEVIKYHHAVYFLKEMEKVSGTKASEMEHLIIIVYQERTYWKYCVRVLKIEHRLF